MKITCPRVVVSLWVVFGCGLGARSAPFALTPVAVPGQPAPGTAVGTNADLTFALRSVPTVDLNHRGEVIFSADLRGAAAGSTNGLWVGMPGSLTLLARDGMPAPGAGQNFRGFGAVSINSATQTVFYADVVGAARNFGGVWGGPLTFPFQLTRGPLRPANGGEVFQYVVTFHHNGSSVAAPVSLTDENTGVIAGSLTNPILVAREGQIAPGATTNRFGSFDEQMALLADGSVFFSGSIPGGEGVWGGTPTNIQPVFVPGRAAASSIFGRSDLTNGQLIGANISANARGDLAYAVSLVGPGLSNANNTVLLAGPINAPRLVARQGTPGPGSGTNFASFTYVALGFDGRLAFRATYGAGGETNTGLWVAPSGGEPRLLARAGGVAPGDFGTNTTVFTGVFDGPFLNAAGQVAFRATVRLNTNTTGSGVWLAEPDGAVQLVAGTGSSLRISATETQRLETVQLGGNSPTAAGSEDGRLSPLNDLGQIVFVGSWGGGRSNAVLLSTPVRFTRIARNDAGTAMRLTFPTASGHRYRVEHTPALVSPPSAIAWTALISSLNGTGNPVTVTDSSVASQERRYYRIVLLD